MMNLLRTFMFLIVFCVTAKSDNIPASQLFVNVLKGLETPVFKLMPLTGWGEIRFPASEQEMDADNIILEGAFEQGMLLVKYSEKISLQTFAILDYTKDSEKFDWNNRAKLAAGIKFNYVFNKKSAIDVGVKYEWDYRSETERTLKDYTVFVNWFSRWSLDSSSSYPGYTWGGVTYYGSNKNLKLSGAVEQGVDWYSFSSVTVNVFARFAYTFDTEDHWINNNVTYGIGSQLKIPVTDEAATHVGFLFNQNKRLENGRTENQISSFVNWYF